MDALDPRLIAHHKKKDYLKEFDEDSFREHVVRPLFMFRGFEHGQDTCGVNEQGKDCYFWSNDVFGNRQLIVIQTKKGDLKMTREAKTNVVEAGTQLNTALNTTVADIKTHKKFKPMQAYLVASGEINEAARKHIVEELNDPRLQFMDSEVLIPLIDKDMAELWNGIDVAKLPYLKGLRKHIFEISRAIEAGEIGVDQNAEPPVTAENFLTLYFTRYYTKLERYLGQPKQTLGVEEVKAEELITKNESLITVTGGPGAGKTTTLRRLAMILIEKALKQSTAVPTPVLLTASDIASTAVSIAEHAGSESRRFTPDKTPGFDENDLSSGNVFLLVDGLDEVGNEEQRGLVYSKVLDFLKKYPQCHAIVATRDYPEIVEGLEKHKPVIYRISPISFKQAEKLIVRLSTGKTLSVEDQQEMLRRLDNIHGIELNPLLVTVFVAISEFNRSDIPANITELFKKYTEMMLGRWNRSKGLAEQFHAPLKDFLLCRVAFTMHAAKRNYIERAEAEALIKKELQERDLESDYDALVEEMVLRSGLFRFEEGGKLIFRHLLLQEFFAGRGIESPSFVTEVASDAWWTRAIVFYFGENAGNMEALKGLLHTTADQSPGDVSQIAITAGLATQACYLLKKAEKIEAITWVVDQLANSHQRIAKNVAESKTPKADSLILLTHYLYARDAVAAKVILDVYETIQKERLAKPSAEADNRLFWCLAGLIESRQIEAAKAYVKDFDPEDQKLLLLLYLGAHYVAQLHIMAPTDKKLALEVCEIIKPRAEHLFEDFSNSMRTMLLEIRQGVLTAIGAAPEVQPKEKSESTKTGQHIEGEQPAS